MPRTLKSFYALATLIALLHGSASAQSNYPFVPTEFDVPQQLETKTYRLRMLTVSDVVKDYDAVISSAAHIQKLWPEVTWPTGLTLEQNLIDLGWHQKEFQRRRSFAYTVTDLEDKRVIGCVYIDPTRKIGYDAEIYLWTRPQEQTDLITTDGLRTAVRAWLKQDWPFASPVFPGTDVDWEAWTAIAETKR